ncbi:uncharacterized protein LOC128385900 [Panonychus citri]|uniref:uncharacterized protein LOC128385900 n=1 Tax=Panonychus citri TaxID=50023 RepID=UPI002306F567|nr:uncharacterized protein LOC128385900 [Panonychus citri]
MSFRREAGNPFIPRRSFTIMDTENYIHETIMYLISILGGEESCSMELTKLTVELCKRGNTKPLKKMASGDSIEERVLAFAWQHPSIFDTNERIISLRPMKPEIDDELECNLEERLIQFLVFRCNQYGPCQIPISKLLGNLHQAASDIRFHFHNNDYSRFHNFLRTRDDIFTLIDSETVALKTVLDKAKLENKSLLKCDEYFLDGRVLNCTRMVDTFSEGIQIVREILDTKDIVAIDCEGVNLGAPNGYITLVQLAIVDELPENHTDEDIANSIKIYLFDVQADVDLMYIALKKLLKAEKITKIFQGCSSDATALYNRYKIITASVFDTVIAHRHLNEGAKSDLYYLYEYYVGEGTNRMKKDIKKKYIFNPRLWTTRPLTELLTYYAAFDVYALIRIYYKLKNQIDEKTYKEIWDKSSATAQSAYIRALPLYAASLYNKGYTLAQVHAEIGWELDSDDEKSLGIHKSKSSNNYNGKSRSRQYTVNGKPNYQNNKHPRNFNRLGESGGSSATTVNHPNRNTPNFDNNNGNNNYSEYYNGNALYRSSHNQYHRSNHYSGKSSVRFQRPTLPQNHSNPQQHQTNHYDNTQHYQQRNYYQYQQPQFKYQQPYQGNFQYQHQYQPNVQYQQQYQFQQPQHHQYQQNQNQYQQPSTQIPHQSKQHYHHQPQPQPQPQLQQQQQQMHFQSRNQQFNTRRNVQN